MRSGQDGICHGRRTVPVSIIAIWADVGPKYISAKKVGIDVLGPFPKSYTGNVNIIVAVDYLTKWVEAKSLPTGEATDVATFIVENIFLAWNTPPAGVGQGPLLYV